MLKKYKGVTYNQKTGKWKAQVFIGSKNRNLGYFGSEHDAARMWDTARVRLQEFFRQPVPKLNTAYSCLHDPEAMDSLRSQLVAEGVEPIFHEDRIVTKDPTPEPAETLKNLGIRLLKAEDDIRDLARQFLELKKLFPAGRLTLSEHLNTSRETGRCDLQNNSAEL